VPTANAIRDYILDNSPWVNRERTVDTVLCGDGNRPIRKGGVCWYPDLKTLKVAHETGCELLVVHESLFWNHWGEPKWQSKEPGLTKLRFLEESRLVVLRLHDSWDEWPGIGIRDSFAAGLGLTNQVYATEQPRYFAIYEVPEQTLREFAGYVARKIKPTGEDSVQVIGDPARVISRVGIGVGCAVPQDEIVAKGADVLLHCYDGAPYWNTRDRLAELGAAIITLEHGTTEMWGLENLRHHLNEVYPDIEWQYLAEHKRTWTVKSS